MDIQWKAKHDGFHCVAFVAVQPAALNSQPLRRRAVSEIHLRARLKLGVAHLNDLDSSAL